MELYSKCPWDDDDGCISRFSERCISEKDDYEKCETWQMCNRVKCWVTDPIDNEIEV